MAIREWANARAGNTVRLSCLSLGLFAALLSTGCAGGRVHVRPELSGIDRVAVINLAEEQGRPLFEGEYFTNEFVSVGFLVVERGHLQDVIREAFTQSGYLDERSVAEWGKGLGINGVVLNQMRLTTQPADKGPRYAVSGWVRIVEVEKGVILLGFNTETVTSSVSIDEAARRYAQSVVETMSRAMAQKGITPRGAPEASQKPQAAAG